MSNIRPLRSSSLFTILHAAMTLPLIAAVALSGCTNKPVHVTKNRAALALLSEHPHVCSSGDDCPAGAYCDATTSMCAWDCFASSDCGGGRPFSGGGRCPNNGPPRPPRDAGGP